MLDQFSSLNIEVALTQHGPVVTYLLVYLGGLALNLTPCVYPLIPVTVGIFGGFDKTAPNRQKLTFSALYVLGIAITYSILGSIAALSGRLLGSTLQHPAVLIFMAIFLIAMGLSQFGLFEIRLSSTLLSKMQGGKTKYLQSLIAGLSIGIVAAPCLGPFVLGLLTYVSQRQDVFEGFSLFFVLAIGLGTPYLFLAYFSTMLTKLPKSGVWMIWVKKFFGYILFGMALYFITPMLPGHLIDYLFLLLSIIVTIHLGIFEGSLRGQRRLIRSVAPLGGITLIALAALNLSLALHKKAKPDWIYANAKILEEKIATEKPVIVDLYADWCIPCKELDTLVFTHPEVIELTKRFQMLKIDMTKNEDPEIERLLQHFNVFGMPTILFFNKGQEIRSLRVTSLIPVDKMISILKQVTE